MIIRRAGRDRPVHMLEAVGLDPSPRFEDTDVPEVGVFGCDAAEVVPHGGDDVRDLALRKPRKSAFDIALGVLGDTEKWADQASHRAAKRRGPIERQYCEGAEQQRRSPGLQVMDRPGRLN